MKNRKKFLGMVSILLCTVIISVFAACSSSGSSAAAGGNKPATLHSTNAASTAAAGMADAAPAKAADATTTKEYGAAQSTATTSAAAAALSNQKIIQNLSYQIETLKFDDSIKKIQSLSIELGGYVQDSSVSGKGVQEQGNLRSASYVLRIPQGKLDQFKNSAGNIGSVLNFTSSSENVSERYYDTEARLKSLRTQQERLLALLKKSGSLTDVIALEKALADVNYQIEQFTGTLRQYDSLIGFSTVSIQLNEVVKPTEVENIPVTLGDKIARQFKDSVRSLGNFGEGLLVFLIGGAPIILLLVVIAAVVIFIIRKRRKHARKKNEEQMVLITSAVKEPEKDEEHPEK
jgi:hypothetical protein